MIPVERRPEAMNILAWPTFAFRPLSSQEVVEALKLSGSDNDIGPNSSMDRISELSFGLAAVVRGQVVLIHQTLREFLLLSGPLAALDPRQGHTLILSACLDALLEEPELKSQEEHTHDLFDDEKTFVTWVSQRCSR